MMIADTWFERRKLDDDVTIIWEPHVVPLLRCNIWHIRGRDRDLMVDTGIGVVSLREFARDILDKPISAVATHAHIDHIGNHHEFDDCIVHRLEAQGLQQPSGDFTLADANFNPADIATLRIPPIAGYDISGSMLTALPDSDFELQRFAIRPAKVGRIVEDGDVIDLGDRIFEVLHLPGHSPGGIGLWEERTQTLFSGDSIYDGPLLDTLHHSSIPQYIRTMERLRDLPVKTVHAGHDPSFGRERLLEIANHHLKNWQSL
jgi:glyoxylase-like metal-dependent hydrolase (beta-lactamase superfamily II)